VGLTVTVLFIGLLWGVQIFPCGIFRMEPENKSLLGKRKLENRGNTDNNDSNNNNNNINNGRFPTLRKHSNIPPLVKRARMNNTIAPAQGPNLTRRNVMVPPGAPRKAPRFTVKEFSGPLSSLKGTKPKFGRRITHTNKPHEVRTYELNNNAKPMTHTNSQTYQTFHRYILPCLHGKIPLPEIQELYDMYVKMRTEKRRVPSGASKLNQNIISRNAQSAAAKGALMSELQNVNTIQNYRTLPRTLRTLDPKTGAFTFIDGLFSEIHSQYAATDKDTMKTKMRNVYESLKTYLTEEQRGKVERYLKSLDVPSAAPAAEGGKRRRRTAKQNCKRRSTRKN
jgi:hypothetical protein